jgi:hypothetical protein
MEPIQITFSLTPLDYERAIRFNSLRQRTTWINAIIVFGVMIGILYFVYGPESFSFYSILMLLIAVPLAVLIATVGLFPYVTRFQMTRDPASAMRQEWSFSETELQQITEHSQGRISWQMFKCYRESRDAFYLIRRSNPRLFHILPKRAFASPQDIERLRELLKNSFVPLPAG